jgi:dTDP-N-acetylfucosamine:lipid II N-acetylfucosaminyltransferase
MTRIVHFLPDEKFTDDFISSVRKYSSGEKAENVFLLKTDPPYRLIEENREEVHAAPARSAAFTKFVTRLTEDDELIIHYPLPIDFQRLLTLKSQGMLAAQVGWVFWGAEIYTRIDVEDVLLLPNTRRAYRPFTIKNTALYRIPFYRWIEKQYVRWKNKRKLALYNRAAAFIDHFYHFNEPEFQFVAGLLPNLKADMRRFFYPRFSYNLEKFDLHLFEKKDASQKKQGLNIMVGHSATPMNNHLDIFEQIPVREDIRIWVPLSYGSEYFHHAVMDAGQARFGKQFRPILEYMSYQEYVRLLSRIDAFVSGTLRPIAMGNILIFLFLNIPIFLLEESPLYTFLRQEGFKVFPMQKLQRFLDGESPDCNNHARVLERFGPEQVKAIYSKLF